MAAQINGAGATPTGMQDFLLAEYQSISQAHFNTNEAIGAFFKNYLAIVGIPITAAGLILTYLGKSSVPSESLPYEVPVLAGSWLVGVVGLCVMAYVVNLRLDALLYARQVNGIRQHFLNEHALPIEHEHALRVLPRSTSEPPYVELQYFVAVIAVFALLDGAYPAAGFFFYLQKIPASSGSWSPTALYALAACFALLHFGVYWLLAEFREARYLRSFDIGVDIDGVLNEHRAHFCRLLNQHCKKVLDPERITHIPVHELADANVTREDTYAVFNWPEFWSEVPVASNAQRSLAEIANTLGCRVLIFSHRPYPEVRSFPQSRAREYCAAWRRVLFCWRVSPRAAITRLTKRWLKRHKIPCDRLIIERGSAFAPDPRSIRVNRFELARRRKIRVFVEDELPKARKLARTCELVFLLDHPYNQADELPLPNNVVRVANWDELHCRLREVL